MKPEDFRELKISPGVLVGLIGDYNGPSFWSGEKQIQGILSNYLVLERHHTPWRPKGEKVWDAAVTVSLSVVIGTGNPYEKCITNELLLIQRYPDMAWESDCVVHVFGIPSHYRFSGIVLPLEEWKSNTVHLSLAATLTVLNL